MFKRRRRLKREARRKILRERSRSRPTTYFEALEDRVMFSTLTGGDIFEFIDANNQTVRVVLGGDSTDQIELIGAAVNSDNVLELGNLAGSITGGPRAGTDLFGGVSGKIIDRIGGIRIESDTPEGTLSHNPAGSTATNVQALASRNHIDIRQQTYGFNVVEITDTNGDSVRLIQLFRFGDPDDPNESGVGIFVANLQTNVAAFPQDMTTNQTTVTQITAADFDPVSGLLYFTATSGDGPVGSNNGIDRLYTVDVDAGSAAAIEASVAVIPGTFGEIDSNSVSIASIAFDQDGPASSRLYAFITTIDGLATTVSLSEVDQTNTSSTFFGGFTINEANGDVIDSITGIEFIDADPNALETQLFAITSEEAESRLFVVDLDLGNQTTTAREVGKLPDPTDAAEETSPQRGQNLQGLSWNPTMQNPFDAPGVFGTLLATDGTSDELVAIDTRLGIIRQGDIFQIYVADSDENTSISIAVVRTVTDPINLQGDLLPYQGVATQGDNDPDNDSIIESDNDRYDLLVTPTLPPSPFVAKFAPRLGGVHLGGRAFGFRPGAILPSLIVPVTNANLGGVAIGVRPAGLDDLPGDLNNDIAAGIVVAQDGLLNDQNINKVLVGGKVTGRVDISGSIDTFYAGALLTGLTGGQNLTDTQDPENFRVGGDLRNLIVRGSIGTNNNDGFDDGEPIPLNEPRYNTGFDLVVDGKIGQVVSQDSFIGEILVNNGSVSSFGQLPVQQNEVEVVVDPNIFTEGNLFQDFELWRTDGGFRNETFDTAQYVGTVTSTAAGGEQVTDIAGSLNGDDDVDDLVDYYAMGLLAGQTVTVQLADLFQVGLHVGVFDSDGRLVASNDSNVDRLFVSNQAFQFTADRPGAYRFAVAYQDDVDFNGQLTRLTAGRADYNLVIHDAGDIALGGLVVENNVFHNTTEASLTVANGDLGAIAVGGILFYEGPVEETDIRVMLGGLRSIVADQIGLGIDVNTFGPNILVDEGSIGLIRSTGTAGEGVTQGLINIETAFVGGDLQWVDAAGTLFIDLDAEGGVGVVRAEAMDSFTPSIFNLNTDETGNDGVIDLIDVTGDFGTFESGGPQITAGPGGNIRYIRVGGEVFQDSLFGGDGSSTTHHDPGVSVTLIDDSGATVVLSPIGRADDPDFDPMLPVSEENPRTFTPSLDVTTYGIRDGGVVIMEVISDAGVAVQGRLGNEEVTAEITRIIANGLGREIQLNKSGKPSLTPRVQINDNDTNNTDDDVEIVKQDINVSIAGMNGIVVDVFEVVGGRFTSIINSSGGELANVTAESIGALFTSGTLGLAKSSMGEAVVGREVVANNFPFVDQRTGIVSGHIIEVRAGKGLGNLIVDGAIKSITANADRKLLSGEFEGINAPVYATGDIFFVQIGQGIAPSGSGASAGAGLFSDGNIFAVQNQGVGSNIWGDIVAQERVGTVKLANGSIINADIMSAANLDDSREQLVVRTASEVQDAQERVIPEVGPITVNGNGGIIGAFVFGADIGKITVRRGFGILNSTISSVGEGVIDLIMADGLGIQGLLLDGGATAKGLVATGRGTVLDVLNYSSSIRLSENFSVDPLFGTEINRLNDLHEYLGTSAATPAVEGKTNAGVIDDVTIRGSRNLKNIHAYAITNSQFNVANSISTIFVRGSNGSPVGGEKIGIDNLTVVTGELVFLKTDSDVNALNLNVRGKINRIDIGGDLLEDSVLSTDGIRSNVRVITVRGDVDGDILVSGILTLLDVRGDINGNIVVGGDENTSTSLKILKLGGAFLSGTLLIKGNVGAIDAAGDFGTQPGLDQLIIQGNLGRLRVGIDRKTDGSMLGLDLTVLGNLGLLDVQGEITGSVNVHGNLNMLKVTADAATQSSDILSGNVKVHRNLRTLIVNNGDVSALIDVGQNINTFFVRNGAVLAGGEIRSVFGNINRVITRNGGLDGAVAAENGWIGAIHLLGANADLGANASIVTQNVTRAITIAGEVLAGASINVSNRLKSLTANGAVETGVSIDAGTLGWIDLKNDFLGDLTITGNATRAVNMRVRGDMGGTINADSNLQLTVDGHVTATSKILVTQNLARLAVKGDLMGDVIVEGYGGVWSASNINGAVITTGFNLNLLIVKGTITQSLIQTGMSPGDDGVFADGTIVLKDTGETSRTGRIGRLFANAIDDSVIAAGGAIGLLNVSKGTITNSSVSTGFTVGSEVASDLFLNGTASLATGAGQDAARSGMDRSLFHGTFGRVLANTLVNSDLTAGVDSGDDGQFGNADDSVLRANASGTLPNGGGRSGFMSGVVRNSDAASNVLADTGFGNLSVIGATNLANVDGNLTYDLFDAAVEALLAPNQSYSGLITIGTASAGSNVVFLSQSGDTLTVSVTGNGTVQVLDDTAAGADTDNTINTLIISGTTTSSRITLTNSNPNGVDITRMLSADDTQFHTLSFDGELAGGMAGDVGLWLDSGGRTLKLGTLGANVVGQVSGGVTTVSIATQDIGMLRVAGKITTLNIGQSQGTPASGSEGIVADSISRLNITGTSAYLGHVKTTGNSVGIAKFIGDFGGELVSSGAIGQIII